VFLRISGGAIARLPPYLRAWDNRKDLLGLRAVNLGILSAMNRQHLFLLFRSWLFCSRKYNKTFPEVQRFWLYTTSQTVCNALRK